MKTLIALTLMAVAGASQAAIQDHIDYRCEAVAGVNVDTPNAMFYQDKDKALIRDYGNRFEVVEYADLVTPYLPQMIDEVKNGKRTGDKIGVTFNRIGEPLIISKSPDGMYAIINKMKATAIIFNECKEINR